MLRMTTTITAAFAIIGLCTFVGSSLTAAQQTERQKQTPPSLSELRQLASDWKSSFRNLRVDGHRSYVNTTETDLTKWSPSDVKADSSEFSKVAWIWSTGRLDRFEETRIVVSSPAPPNPYKRMVEVYNGRNESYFTAEYETGEDQVEHLKKLNITRVIESSPPVTSAWDLLPWLYEQNSRRWLEDRISIIQQTQAPIRPPVSNEGSDETNVWDVQAIELVLGSRCAKLTRVSSAGGEPQQRTQESLWLDLDHGGVPRRALVEYFSDPGSLSGRQEYLVDEYQLIDGKIWFPKVARYQQQPAFAWLITLNSIQLDVELRDEDFEPPAPEPDTEVEHSLGLILITPIDSAEKVQTPPPEPTSSSLWLLLAGLGTIVVLTGILTFRKRHPVSRRR